MDSAGQKQALRDLGVDPDALEQHYQPFIERAAQLKREDAEADKKTAVTGVVSALATGTIVFLKRTAISPIKLVQGFAVGLSSIAAGVVGTFVGSRVFAEGIRDKSKQLTIEAKDAFERELAVALENKEREARANPVKDSLPKMATAIPPRDPSFAAQAAADKNAAAEALTHRA